MLKKLFQKRISEILNGVASSNIILDSPSANFFGQESKGLKQIRGTGVLALTENELLFEMWKPTGKFKIPLVSIKGIETPKSFLRKTKFNPLLKIVFENERGELDSAAWLVRDLQKWLQSIENMIQKNN